VNRLIINVGVNTCILWQLLGPYSCCLDISQGLEKDGCSVECEDFKDYSQHHLGYVTEFTPVSTSAAFTVHEDALNHRTAHACQTIRSYPGVSERTRRSMIRRVEACSGSHGRYFEHLQMYSLSRNSQIKSFRAHADMDIFLCSGMCKSFPK
jgi:hypothetical protein